MSKITLENISFYHAKGTPYEIKALKNINVSIPEGCITGLIGHTGSGKSTLVQMFNGLLTPHEGRVLIDGNDIWSDKKKIRDVRFKVGLVMQYPEYQLFEETVYRDIAFGPTNMGLNENEVRDRVLEAAEFVGLESALLEKSPFDLSGGQKRRAAIAGIIAMRPEVLVLDEPAAGLDPRGRDAIFANIADYQKKSGSTVVIVSHSMEDMAKLCDHLIVMSDGEILMSGDRGAVFAKADMLTSVGLDVPQITRLMNNLRARGVDVDGGLYTIDIAVEFFKKYIRENGN
ncbi:MAG: energy-coupling factor transporter ATPase [Ruminococcaceae bacterium]|nr:energy-coupling factor transporter ATPase [Oscillospiraceae bacterium]